MVSLEMVGVGGSAEEFAVRGGAWKEPTARFSARPAWGCCTGPRGVMEMETPSQRGCKDTGQCNKWHRLGQSWPLQQG